jgi:hypothetical protein
VFRLLRVAKIVLVWQELLYDARQRREENVGVFGVIKFSLNLSQADDFA